MEPASPSRRARIAAMLALLAVAAVVAAGLVAHHRFPDVAPPASETEFDTDRAWTHLERIVGEEPAPIGSQNSAEVRDYLVEHLESLGLETEVQQDVGARTFRTVAETGRVDNVVATLPGTDPTGRVYLAAHYDTTPTTPGTTDDLQGVATILEIARVLAEREQPRNDVVFLLSDGEEPGLLGAEAFAEHHPDAPDGGVVLNLEGAGNAGPSALYNTSSGNAELVSEWADTVPYPAGESGFAALWAEAPFNSDFTALEEAGFIGMEFSPLDGRAYYHHPSDTLDNFAPKTLHHQGVNALAMADTIVDRDIAELRAESDTTFFTVFGQVLGYPGFLVLPLALLSVAGVAALAVLTRLRARVNVSHLLGGVLTGLLAIAVSMGAAWGLWQLLLQVRPGYAGMVSGDPYQPEFYRWAILALSATVAWAGYFIARRRLREEALVVGALLWPALVGLTLAVALPPMAYFGTIAALAASTGAFAAWRAGAHRPVLRCALLATGVLPGALLLTLSGYIITTVMGIGLGAAGALCFAMAALLVAPLVSMAVPASGGPRPILVPLTAGLLTAALTATGLAVDTFDEEHPYTANLYYVLDADTEQAVWASDSSRPHAWAADYVTDERDPDPLSIPAPTRSNPAWTGDAPALSLPAPEIEVADTRTGDGTLTLDLVLHTQRSAEMLILHLDRPIAEGTVTVPDLPATELSEMEAAGDDAAEWPYEVTMHNPPEGDVELTLRFTDEKRPELGVSDVSFGLAEVPGYSERPDGVVMEPAGGGAPTDSIIVSHTHEW
ncbi:hypothetical protein F4561_006091 [Lipingzhangella halophila]|uniref:Vacuolar membrane protease n=1 Tax=Lipingzhangella halophila TaxID=1783352 RepID=A0A7W7RNX9_9ACTN|nr:M28 family peptidase [Lipingzhangella halophila]MBB4935197.1 hypothetical protein [Lipingzhangella halophila]